MTVMTETIAVDLLNGPALQESPQNTRLNAEANDRLQGGGDGDGGRSLHETGEGGSVAAEASGTVAVKGNIAQRASYHTEERFVRDSEGNMAVPISIGQLSLRFCHTRDARYHFGSAAKALRA
jgi:hypothetical protein